MRHLAPGVPEHGCGAFDRSLVRERAVNVLYTLQTTSGEGRLGSGEERGTMGDGGLIHGGG